MKKKHFLSSAAAILAAAAVIGIGALSVSAAQNVSSDINTDAAVQTLAFDENNDASLDIKPIANDNKTDKSGKKKDKSVSWVKIILISFGISAVVTGITVYFIYNGYKHNGKTEPYEYTKKAPLDLTDSQDELVDVRVTSVHIERNNN